MLPALLASSSGRSGESTNAGERIPHGGAGRAGRARARGIRRRHADNRRRNARCGRAGLAVLRRHDRRDRWIGDRRMDGRRRTPVAPRDGDPARQPHHEPRPVPGLRDHRNARGEGVSGVGRCRARGRRLDASQGSRSRASRRSRRSGDRGDCNSRGSPVPPYRERRCRPSRRPASFQSGRTTRFTVPRSRSSETLTCRICRRSCSPGSRSCSITMLRTCSRPPLPASSAFLHGA